MNKPEFIGFQGRETADGIPQNARNYPQNRPQIGDTIDFDLQGRGAVQIRDAGYWRERAIHAYRRGRVSAKEMYTRCAPMCHDVAVCIMYIGFFSGVAYLIYTIVAIILTFIAYIIMFICISMLTLLLASTLATRTPVRRHTDVDMQTKKRTRVTIINNVDVDVDVDVSIINNVKIKKP